MKNWLELDDGMRNLQPEIEDSSAPEGKRVRESKGFRFGKASMWFWKVNF